jgi:hypothetical protein
MRRITIVLLTLVAAVLPLGLFAQSGDVERWWAHVTFLADDALAGRETGSPGYRRAAEYVAAHLKREGVAPAGSSGYMQPVSFRVRQYVEERSSLAIVRQGRDEAVALGDEATFSMRIEHAPRLEAPIVFVGYGLSLPEAGYDDLAGVDLKGKVALYLTGGPSGIPGALLAHAQSASERWQALKRAGAIGTIGIPNPRSMDIPWDRSKLSRFLPAMVLSDRSLDDTAGQQLALTLNPARAERWFAGAPHSLSELRALADGGKPLPHFLMPVSVKATVAFDASTVESDNVVGLLKGSDPVLSREYVVISAHLDHVGTSSALEGDKIFNGAMDNASGIATLLDLATRLRTANRPLKRSVVFLAVTAEEKGLLGSKYFANRPTVTDGSIVANINTDMFLPLFPMTSVVALGLDESDLADDLRRAAQALGIEALPDPEPERNTFIRSDQYNFIRRGVPALALKVGYRLKTPEADLVKRWLAERYHGPSDDLSQPIDRDAAVRFTALVHGLTESVANRATRPEWRETSFFRRFAQSH